VEFVLVTEAVTEKSAVLTTAELNVELVFPDKHAPMESVSELVLPNAPELTEVSELAVGIDATEMDVVELAPTAIPATSDVVMEHANVSPTVTTSTVEMMAAEDPVELVPAVLSAKEPATHSPDNATSTVTLTFELKLESSSPTIWLPPPVQSPSLDPAIL
jgi:hypothetical protein